MKTLTKEAQAAITPSQAIDLLKEGNKRFIGNLKASRDLLQQVNETSNGQYPFAFILSCIDSRAPVELIFDQGLGDIFTCRVAGNILNEDVLGSMEFACKVAGSKAILVLGHTKCGAVKGACDGVELGNLTALLSKLKPALEAEQTTTENRTASNPEFVQHVADLNVKIVMKQVRERSPVLAEMLDKGEIALAGGMYDVETGQVEFYENATSSTILS